MSAYSDISQEIEWLGDRYRVTAHYQSGTMQVDKWVVPKYRKPRWEVMFSGHVELLKMFVTMQERMFIFHEEGEKEDELEATESQSSDKVRAKIRALRTLAKTKLDGGK